MAHAAVRPRPLDLGDLFDELFRIYRSHFLLLAGVSLLIQIPSVIWAVVFGGRFSRFASASPNRPVTPTDLQNSFLDPAFLGGLALLGVLSLLLAPFLYGAVFQAAADAVQGRDPSLPTVFAEIARRYLPIWGWILAFWFVLALIAATCIGIPVAIWLGVAWCLSGPTLFIERRGPIESLNRSWQLMRAAWWRTFGVLLLAFVLVEVLGGALGLVAQLAGLAVPDPGTRLVVISVLGSIFQSLTGPVVPILLMLLYLDRRVRAEGLELETMARAAAVSGPPAYAPPPPGGSWQSPSSYPAPPAYGPPPGQPRPAPHPAPPAERPEQPPPGSEPS